MKVTAEHLANLTEAIAPLDTPERRTAYRNGDFAKADAVKDLDKRYRWDLFWAAWDAAGQSPEFLAQYNDAHLDTALRHIVPVLGEEPAVLPKVTTEELTELVTTGQPLTVEEHIAQSIEEFDIKDLGFGVDPAYLKGGTFELDEAPSIIREYVNVEAIAKANVNQSVGITLTDGRSFSTKILEVIERPGSKPSVLVKGWAYKSGDYNPFAVVKYPLAQVADFAPFGADLFVTV